MKNRLRPVVTFAKAMSGKEDSTAPAAANSSVNVLSMCLGRLCCTCLRHLNSTVLTTVPGAGHYCSPALPKRKPRQVKLSNMPKVTQILSSRQMPECCRLGSEWKVRKGGDPESEGKVGLHLIQRSEFKITTEENQILSNRPQIFLKPHINMHRFRGSTL